MVTVRKGIFHFSGQRPQRKQVISGKRWTFSCVPGVCSSIAQLLLGNPTGTLKSTNDAAWSILVKRNRRETRKSMILESGRTGARGETFSALQKLRTDGHSTRLGLHRP